VTQEWCVGTTRLKRSAWAGTALALLCAAAPRHAHAESGTNPAVAEALYEEARALMKQGKLDQACPKLKQSYDLDPGGGTLLNLAECYEKQGKLASAWSSFNEARVQAQRDARPERVEYAKKHIAAIEPKLSKITIEVPSDATTPGLRVLLDGAELGSAAWNVGVPIDPGMHELAASAPSKLSFDKKFEIAAASASTTLTIPKLEDAPVAVGASAARPVDQDVQKKPVPGETSASNSSRTVGYVLLGAGVVGIGVGSYFGLHSFSKWKERKDDCVNGCTADAKTAGDAARSSALVSDIGFGVGLIAAGVGTYLILSSKHASETGATTHRARAEQAALQLTPVLRSGGGGLWLQGSY
jgi:hypothetical protein